MSAGSFVLIDRLIARYSERALASEESPCLIPQE
jgi:hypothetical protein